MVKISIIIPSFNQGEFLEETILSVLQQNYSCWELLVMDGGSTDNSLDIIKKYSSHISYWQSLRDCGQSDAINQGIRRATGDIVTWLNSDDVLLPGVLEQVAEYAERYPGIQWFLGNVLWMDKHGKIIRVGKVEMESRFWNTRHIFSNGGPSAFMRRSRLIQIGALREDFHYMMDTELWHRFITHGDLFVRIPIYCWGLRLHENAKMSGHNFKNSELANQDHPSWIQKKKESKFLKETYPINEALRVFWLIWRLWGCVLVSRLTDKHLLNKLYTSNI